MADEAKLQELSLYGGSDMIHAYERTRSENVSRCSPYTPWKSGSVLGGFRTILLDCGISWLQTDL